MNTKSALSFNQVYRKFRTVNLVRIAMLKALIGETILFIYLYDEMRGKTGFSSTMKIPAIFTLHPGF